MNQTSARLRFLRKPSNRRRRRGVSLLPSLFTMGNMFCGYACIVYAMRSEFETAALFIGFAIVLDMLDGRIARLTGTTSDFGAEFDSLADVVSFGIAPAVLSLAWGLNPLGRLGWAAGFLFVAAAAMRLARFNIQNASDDKRYFVGMPSPTAAGIPASTVFFHPAGVTDHQSAVLALAMVLVPAMLMVSTVRFRSFKTIDLRARRPYSVLFLVAAGLTLITIHPKFILLVMAYTYLVSPMVGQVVARLRRKGSPADVHAADVHVPQPDEQRRAL
jgi:CDP-diacylglycerol--serine O-phosphatidyltransferase